MIYQFTGQPGHGKTLHAVKRAMDFRAAGRIVYVCNVRQFDYGKTGMLPMSPDEFKNWMEFLPDGAVALVDECYEHGMLPKRPPSAAVPKHVQELAKHRHRGIDFIFVCQSPDKQMDSFTHDLIEEHTHVRRRFGTKHVHLRRFDRFEPRPEKVAPLVLTRTTLPKKAMGTYQSTELDTTEKKIPWYFYALGVGVPVGVVYILWVFGGMSERLTGSPAKPAISATQGESRSTEASADGVPAAVEPVMTAAEYAKRFVARIPSQPWTAPAYDQLQVASEAPRIFCMSGGSQTSGTCNCLTEQGTRYKLDVETCRLIAIEGQYEPFRDERENRLQDGREQQASLLESQRILEEQEGSYELTGGDPQRAAMTGGGVGPEALR